MKEYRNIQQVYINGSAATYFDIWELEGNTWVFQTRDKIWGHYKKASTVQRKYESQ